ncbi:hypothetical protein IQ60_00100 [Streptomyces europaeiscabiei]|nr:hypothetical protein IQ60_00100 [Streptomyces europaeiscabiei]
MAATVPTRARNSAVCRVYRRVLDIQQQPHQLFRSLRNIDERAVCATTLEPVDGSQEIGGA